MTVPWDVASLWSQEKVSGAELLDTTKELQPISGTRLANEAPAANGGPRGSGGDEPVHRICQGSAGREVTGFNMFFN